MSGAPARKTKRLFSSIAYEFVGLFLVFVFVFLFKCGVCSRRKKLLDTALNEVSIERKQERGLP